MGTATRETSKIREKQEKQREQIREAFYNGALYKWWNSTTERRNPIRELYNHVRDTFHRNRKAAREGGQHVTSNFFNLDIKFWKFKDRLVKRWTPQWTPEKLDNNEAVKKVAYKAYDRMWPGRLSRDVQERFLINCDCRIVDETFDLIAYVGDYCVNQFIANIPFKKRGTIDSHIMQMSNRSWFHNHHNVIMPEEDLQRKRDVLESDDHDNMYAFEYGEHWIRPKVSYESERNNHPKPVRIGDLPKRSWRRILVSGQAFDLLDWILCLIEDLFGVSVSQDFAQWVMDVQAWFTNDNTDYLAGPVGFLYWLYFPFRCQFPLNLNCSVGVGLETALGYVLLWSIIVFVGLSLIFPATLLPLIGLGAFLFYVIVVPAVAWHYSPRCWLMSPTFSFGLTTFIPEGTNGLTDFLIWLGQGMTLPGIPWPIAFPAFPECFWDEIIDLFDKWITTCYDFVEDTGLGFILPHCMINGDICPPCDTKIDFANCKEVGVSDGIDNLIYILNYWFPDLCQYLVQNVASICFFNGCLADYFPFDITWLLDKFDEYKNVSPTQDCRNWFCFWATLPTIAFLILAGLLIFTFLGFAIPLVIDFFFALWGVFISSPIAIIFFGGASTFFNLPDDETEIDEDAIAQRIGGQVSQRRRRKRIGGLGTFLESEDQAEEIRDAYMRDNDGWLVGSLASWLSRNTVTPLIEKMKRE